jgi:transcriptional regulator with XRE-family HTH domain
MLRAERQLSQEDVQAKGGLGQNALTRIESGAVSASLASLLRVAEGLGVPVSALMEAFEAQLGKGGR